MDSSRRIRGRALLSVMASGSSDGPDSPRPGPPPGPPKPPGPPRPPLAKPLAPPPPGPSTPPPLPKPLSPSPGPPKPPGPPRPPPLPKPLSPSPGPPKPPGPPRPPPGQPWHRRRRVRRSRRRVRSARAGPAARVERLVAVPRHEVKTLQRRVLIEAVVAPAAEVAVVVHQDVVHRQEPQRLIHVEHAVQFRLQLVVGQLVQLPAQRDQVFPCPTSSLWTSDLVEAAIRLLVLAVVDQRPRAAEVHGDPPSRLRCPLQTSPGRSPCRRAPR